MSANFKCSLADENPDFQKKQIGCMNGLFHHFLGSPRIATPNHQTLPPGSNGKHETEPKIASQRRKENNPKEALKEKQRLSFESPRTSLSSSSCSSNYSSADCTKGSRVDGHGSLPSQTGFPEFLKQEISYGHSVVSLQPSQHSVNLRNVVKDCIYREARGLTVKTAMKSDAGKQRTLKYIDSPRPSDSPKPAMTMNTALDKSCHDITKLREGPRTADVRKDGSLAFVPRDVRRFSYDGRGSNDAVDVKLKDQSRLSLDSREISMKGSSSIVVKLMGLETFPEPILINGNQCTQIKTCRDLNDDPLSLSSRDENTKNRVACSPRNSKKDPDSPCSTNADSNKPIATGCPYEPAPWKPQNPPKAPNSSLTVYGEIEKRLAELEFQESGKDLRALKQILEAIQKSKPMLETRKDDQASNFASHTNSILGQSSIAPNLRNLQSSNTVSGILKGTGSLINIIQPAKCMENASNSSPSVVATCSLRRIRTSSCPADAGDEKVGTQSYKKVTLRPNSTKDPSGHLQSWDKTTSRTTRFNPKPAMSSETRCLKLQQKLELKKQPRRIRADSDQSRSTRQSSRLQAEPGLPHWKPRHKRHDLQRSNDQISDINNTMIDVSHRGNASSMQFESNMRAATYGEIEVTSTNRSYKIEGSVSQKQENNHKNSTTETLSPVKEQPSPVSVLDATFYGDESPSPVKKKSNALKDFDGLIAGEADWNSIGLNDKQLIFDDAVSEILVRKLEKESSYKPWVSPTIRSEIDKQQIASSISLYDEADSRQSMSLGYLILGSVDWSKCKNEIPGVVLDIERLIFKDLICEVISGELCI